MAHEQDPEAAAADQLIADQIYAFLNSFDENSMQAAEQFIENVTRDASDRIYVERRGEAE